MSPGPYILVAEDNFDILAVMRAVLATKGCRVTCAHNGLEAYRAFQHETPALIVSDAEAFARSLPLLAAVW